MNQHSIAAHDPSQAPGAQPTGNQSSNAAGQGWADPVQLDRNGRDHLRATSGALLLLAAVTACDLMLIQATINRVFRELDEASALILAGGLTVASVALMLFAGRQSRIGTASGWTRSGTLTVAALTVGWSALGLALFWLRWNAAAFAPAAAVYDGGSATVTGAAPEDAERMLAVVLIGVYLATGVLAWVEGQKLTNPAAAAMRRSRRQLDQIDRQIAAKAARVARLAENRLIHQQDLVTVEEARQTAREARVALAGELKEHARVQIALHLGDPGSTSLVHDRPRTGPHDSQHDEAASDGPGTGQGRQ